MPIDWESFRIWHVATAKAAAKKLLADREEEFEISLRDFPSHLAGFREQSEAVREFLFGHSNPDNSRYEDYLDQVKSVEDMTRRLFEKVPVSFPEPYGRLLFETYRDGFWNSLTKSKDFERESKQFVPTPPAR